jgi:hypothetical protein
MSRTYRKCEWNTEGWQRKGFWKWRRSPWRDFRVSCVEAHDGYFPRIRHQVNTWPYLTSAYDDIYPSALADKWRCGKTNKGTKIK